jgi:hypothetical protein
VRYRLMATYRGVPYEAGIGPTDGDVVLFAACPPPEELGFEPATGHWRKQLRVQDVQGLWESRPVGTFRGDRCIVLDDLGDRLHIAYLGHDAYQAEQLGYWQVDRGVFELVAPREEVSEIIEERLDYPRRAAGPDLLPPTGAAASFPPEFRAASAPGRAGGSPQAAFAPQGALTPPGSSAPQTALTPPPAPDGPGQAAPRRDVPGTLSAAAVGPADTRQDLAVIPPASEPPLPLEAAALRAASARAGQQAQPQPAQTQPVQLQPAQPPPAQPPQAQAQAAQPPPAQAQPTQAAGPGAARAAPRRRRTALRRLATQRIFSELASLAAIPPSAYAVGEEVDGAMCLIHTPDGFEVFNAAAGSRHEVRLFDDEESAYFYLFGVLAAEAVRTGRLAPKD